MITVEYGMYEWPEDDPRERLKDRKEVKKKRHTFTSLEPALILYLKQSDNPNNDFVRMTLDKTC